MKQIDAIILSCFGYELTSNEKNFFKNINPFGFVLLKEILKIKTNKILNKKYKKSNFKPSFTNFH